MKTLIQTSIIAATLTLGLTGCFPNTNVPTPSGTSTTNQVVTQGTYTVTKPEYIWIGGNECISLIDVEPTIENMTAGALAGIQIFCDENRHGSDYAPYWNEETQTEIPPVAIIPEREGGLPWKVAFFSIHAKDLLDDRSSEWIMGALGDAMNQTNAEYKYCILPPSVPGNSELAKTVGFVRGIMLDPSAGSTCTNYIDPDDYGITVGSVTSMLLTDTAHQDLAAAIEYFISLHP